MKPKEILFAEWIAENHYRLQNVTEGVYWWYDDSYPVTTEELLILFENE